MTVATFIQPDRTVQSGSQYPANIDASISVMRRLGDWFAPHEQATPNMTVAVEAGSLIYAAMLTTQTAQNTGTIVAPSSPNSRIDRVVIDAYTGAVVVMTGTPGVSPVASAITDGHLPVCQVLIPYTATAITNSMITDERVPLATLISNFMSTMLAQPAAVNARGTLGLGTAALNNTADFITAGEGVLGDLTGNFPTINLPSVGPGAIGPIGDATHVAAVTTDVHGRVVGLTPVAITDNGFGIGQTVTAPGKTSGIVYQNLTGKAIFVWIILAHSGYSGGCDFYVGPTNPPAIRCGGNSNNGTSSEAYGWIGGPVPAGHYYEAVQNGGGLGIAAWSEMA
jgi:hypothetical protein